MTKSNPFSYVEAINWTKKDLMRDTDNNELAESNYKPFMVNRALSYYPDTIFLANEMNISSQLDNLLQNDFYINTVRKKKRFAKWSKLEANPDLDSVMMRFGYSRSKAEEALKVLSEESLVMIRNSLVQGGIDHEKRRINKGLD